MSRYRQTMSEALEQVRQQFTEGHSDKDFKPYPDWKKTAGGMYPRFKHSQKGEITIDRYGEWIHSDKRGETIAFYRNHFPKTNTTGGTSMQLTDYLKKINEVTEQKESKQKPYISSSNGVWSVLDADGKEAYKSSNYTLAQAYFKKNFDKLKEENDHEISMARGELEAIADKATQLAGALQGKSDKGNPLEAWVQSKITKAKDYINSVSDYLMYNPDMKQNEELQEARFEVEGRVDYKGISDGDDFSIVVDAPDEKAAEKKVEDMLFTHRNQGKLGPKGGRGVDDYEIESITRTSKSVTNKFSTYQTAEKDLEEGFSSSLKQKAKEIAKKFANNMTKAVDEIEKLAKGLSNDKEVYATLRQYNEEIELDEGRMKDIFTMGKEGESAEEIAKRLKISLSTVKKILGEAIEEPKEAIEEPEKENNQQSLIVSKNKEIETLKGQVNLLKQKIENEKNKAIKPTPNPETGEVPLTLGLANKLLKDKEEKAAEEKKQKEASKQIQNMAKGGEETKLESFTKKYLSHLNESEASDKAKAMGLDYMSFGRYGKDGKVTHKSVGGSLKALSKKDQEKDSDVKPTKPKTKTTGSIKNKDGSNTTSGSVKKEILKKIEDEDLTDPEMLVQFEDELTNLADDLAQTGDKETADKITDAIFAAGEDDTDTPAKIDDMMNALKGKPDLNTAKQKELSKMTSLYTDAKYSDNNVIDFVNDTASIINKMSEVAEAGSMDSDAYGPGIRSDAMAELVSTCSNIQDKIEDMDINDDIKRSVVDALETITDRDTDEFSEEGDVVMSIEKLKYNFKKLAKENKKERKSKALQSSGKKSKVTSDIVDVEPKELKKQAKKYGLTVKIGSGDPDEGYEVEFKGPKKNILKYYKKYMGYDGNDFEGLGSLGDIDENKIIVHKTIINEENLQELSKAENETELEEVTQKEIDKFHTDLDSLVHKTFGHSSKEKEKMDEKVADSIIKDLQKAYAPMKGKRISPEMANKISKHLDQKSYDLDVLRQLKKADIPFISTLARNKIYKKTGRFEERRLYIESLTALKNKAEKTGMPYNILKQVYDRGMAAWKSGHRPGAGQQQWALARVNSFVTKSSGTWGGADKDLAAKVKGSK